ncbi:Tlg1p KNAG_0C06070 [Huiozyma naganishii CBS 8797]|uniref:t-SNARE coiled-coil homology domain-containing protein n=1 Tax=Huiozyma naganishii (strain ATCC MYA-139 / BCRC 22969 / CBS 8797 / KCTC 17520 / NBRC 10181 / NCYC 3082 / Yp74L-3) TaxID=1071383 RepID=J7S571_HUIN7|nr:hypothetical protein KNAG_0C06070 [Kazachstania naganishii CBS 8797]CCK69704.1 hypothetical protein KNAG_0C06070 [Kazachstania naganishii CBS 8797]
MSDVEDPFDQVLKDAEEQLERLSAHLRTHTPDGEVQEILEDVRDTLEDLDRSLIVIQNTGVDTAERQRRLGKLRSEYERLSALPEGGPGAVTEADTAAGASATASGEVVGDEPMATDLSNPFQQQILQEQDSHLDDIHKSMHNLHLHAQTMGQELQDQGELLDQMDGEFDTLSGKLHRGRRQLEWVYEKNKEKVNDCCIMLLIIALIALLVFAFIA